MRELGALVKHSDLRPGSVDDTFGRTTSNGWGTAPIGSAYSISGTAANFSVTGGRGSIISPNAGVLRSALLNTPSVAEIATATQRRPTARVSSVDVHTRHGLLQLEGFSGRLRSSETLIAV